MLRIKEPTVLHDGILQKTTLQNQNEVQRGFHPSYHAQTPLFALSSLLHGIGRR